MSKAAQLFPLMPLLVGTTTVLAINLTNLSQAMDRDAEDVLSALDDYRHDENHFRMDGAYKLVSPVAALNVVEQWQKHTDDDSAVVAIALVDYLSPLASAAPEGFKVEAMEVDEYTFSIRGSKALIAHFEAFEAEALPLLKAQAQPDLEHPVARMGALFPMLKNALPEQPPSQMETLQLAVTNAKDNVARLAYALNEASGEYYRANSIAVKAQNDDLLFKVASICHRQVEALVFDCEVAENALLFAKDELGRYCKPLVANEPTVA